MHKKLLPPGIHSCLPLRTRNYSNSNLGSTVLSPFMQKALFSPGIHSVVCFYAQETTPSLDALDAQLSTYLHKKLLPQRISPS